MRRSVRTVAVIAFVAALFAVFAYSIGINTQAAAAPIPLQESICMPLPPHAASVEAMQDEVKRSAEAIGNLYDMLDAPAEAPAIVRGMGRIVRVGVILAFGRFMFEQFDQREQAIILNIAGQVYDSVTSKPERPKTLSL